MKRFIRNSIPCVTGIFLAVLLGADTAAAQQRDEYGDVSAADVSYQTVARISYLSGSVSFARGDDPDNWQAADQNVPMSVGDRVYADTRSRVELESDGGDVIRVGAQSELSALNLTADTKQFAVKSGIVSFHVGNVGDNDVFEVDTPNSAVTFQQGGDYRVEVDQSGNTRVVVWNGDALFSAGGGQFTAHRGQEVRIEGSDSPRYDVINASARDGWDQWVDGRVARASHATSYKYVNANVVGAADLDESGRWEDIPQYGHVWTPTVVAVDWAPYRVGHWVWQDPWGWTWISAEPWGWAPYHYGRWVTYSSRWYWVPVAPSVQYVSYAPACVAFVGGGPGFSASVTIGGGGFVGWFPLAPRDPFYPWWGPRAASVNVTNVTYVNKTYVTVVNQNTFVSGGVVTTNVVRDRTVVSQVAAAPVVRGVLPVVPTVGALRVASRTNLPAPPRPPAAVLSRSVVARVAPPPAPPTFQVKMAVIKQNNGAPVNPVEAAKISVADRGRPQSITTVRAATTTSGQVVLAPKGGAAAAAAAAKVMPLEAVRGRPLATSAQPVASSVVTSKTTTGVTGPSGRTMSTSREVVARPTAIPPVSTPVASSNNSGRGRVNTERKDISTGKPTPATGGRQVIPNDQIRVVQQPTPRPTAKAQQQYESRSRNSAVTQSGQSGSPAPTGRTYEPEHKRVVVPTAPPKPQNENEHVQAQSGRESPQKEGRGRPLTPTPKKGEKG
jgi:hypothetical protein